MTLIKVMDELLANKIAAGEVVEKCVSVVKELVENSIDANATEIKIELKDSGIKEIKVIDNGIGMDKEDAILAFQRHATSKIYDEDDLYRIETLGFRGEALASIASVSKIELITCKKEVGTTVNIEGGKIIEVKASHARIGTSICVKDLFYNTPARLKHLKSLSSELSNIVEYVDKIALSNPNIRFILSNNGNIILNTDASNNLLKTIKNIYGIEVAKKMIYIEGENLDYKVEGYMSLPEVHRSNRNNMITIVNGRVVRNIELNKVINDSYHSYKPDNRYPIVILLIKTDPTLIDVNIHPTKMDIKFSKFEDLTLLIQTMLKEKLSVKTLIPNVKVEKPVYENIKIDFSEKIESLKMDENKIKENLTLKEEKIETEEIILNDIINEEIDLKLNEEEIEYEENIKEEKQKERIPHFDFVGIVHGTYIICQNEEGMYLIDQHAAKERINYEYYKKKLGEVSNNKISLVFPLTLEFNNNEFLILKEKLDILRNLNFEIEEFGINSVIIKSHPTWLKEGMQDFLIRRIIEIVIENKNDFDIEKFNEKIAISLSCKNAIKANEHISQEEAKFLLKDLEKCDNPFNCPHGRPTIIFYSKLELEKLFKRTGF